MGSSGGEGAVEAVLDFRFAFFPTTGFSVFGILGDISPEDTTDSDATDPSSSSD